MNSPRWQAIAPSSFEWEQQALTFLAAQLPDHEPYRAWSNFEFVADDGTINEVDVLVLTPNGLFLVEIKSRPGEITGDAHSWTWRDGGRPFTVDNPVLLANRKCKKLASLLKRQAAFQKLRVPFIEPVIFCSDPDNRISLPDYVAMRVFARDRADSTSGIAAFLGRPRTADCRSPVDAPLARALGRALNEAGIRPANHSRVVLDYQLEKLLHEHPHGTFQDWLAPHRSNPDEVSLVRLYPHRVGSSREERDLAAKASRRENELLQTLEHQGILQIRSHTDHEAGHALVFRLPKGSRRLDLFMREQGASLGFEERLAMLQQLTDAIAFAHGRGVAHRQLSPHSVYACPSRNGPPQLKIHNWQLGERLGSSASTTPAFSPTQHADHLADLSSAIYQAPEGLLDPEGDGQLQDIFSLGALAYFLFSDKPPATTASELATRLTAERGLQLSAVLDGASKALCDLVQQSTAPAAIDRTENIRAFQRLLDEVENAYMTPEAERTVPPLGAKPGDRIDRDLVVRHRLGSGSTATALLVEWQRAEGPRECVLKVALRADYAERLQAEFNALRKIRSARIVEAFELRTFQDGIVGILVSSAGQRTLSQHLADEGPLALDFLERFGTELLEALMVIEDAGYPHRDIKPSNIGIRKGKDGADHLTLFDFSLSGVQPTDIRCGTAAYLDPFLTDRKPPRWDSAAERYSAALTLYEMATGDLPRWGPDDSHPATLSNEILIDAERFDAGVREELRTFFAKALRRDFRHRFDNAVDMLAAWRRVFHLTESSHPRPEENPASATPSAITVSSADDQLALLGITNRAANALERAGLVTVRDFLSFPVFRLNRLKGIGKKTVRELASLHASLRPRFPEITASLKSRVTEVGGATESPDSGVKTPELLLEQVLVGVGKRESPNALEALRCLLGLPGADGKPRGLWLSQSEVAKVVGVTRQRVGQILDLARERWRRMPSLSLVRAWLADTLRAQGGVAAPSELAPLLAGAHGSTLDEPRRSQTALAVLRAACEAELSSQDARFDEARDHGRVLLALEPELAGHGFALGDAADKLAAHDPLATPQRALEKLREVRLPDGFQPPPEWTPPSDSRLLQLAASASHRAAVSARGEIYPRAMEPRRVLQLAQGALFLSNTGELTEEELQRRVLARYSEAAPLPPRPELDSLLSELGSRLVWTPEAAGGRGAYRPAQASSPASSTNTTVSLVSTERYTPPAFPLEDRAVDERLLHARAEGAYLVLMVPPSCAQAAEHRLLGDPRLNLLHRDFDRLLIEAMRAAAERLGASWERVLRADAAEPGSQDWQKLQQLVTLSLPAALEGLRCPDRTVLLTHPGLLARYDRLSCLAELAAGIGRNDSPLHGLWILLPCDDQNQLPTLLQKPVPVMSGAQWVRVPEAWLNAAAPAA